jgi:hypothetical protein
VKFILEIMEQVRGFFISNAAASGLYRHRVIASAIPVFLADTASGSPDLVKPGLNFSAYPCISRPLAGFRAPGAKNGQNGD